MRGPGRHLRPQRDIRPRRTPDGGRPAARPPSSDIGELRLAEINPGFTFGPLLLRGHYEAAVDQPTQGRLTWQTAETRILGGRFWLPAGTLDLAAPQQRLSARLEGVQLGDVLAAYPDRRPQRQWPDRWQLRRAAQRRRLSVRMASSPRVRLAACCAFARRRSKPSASEPGQKIVTEALHDFHYDLLTSDVRYDENGKLNLGLRLNGHNPTLEGGRPINFDQSGRGHSGAVDQLAAKRPGKRDHSTTGAGTPQARQCRPAIDTGETAMRLRHTLTIVLLGLFASACTPRVELAVPNEPININLNVKIEHEIYIRVDKQLDSIINQDSGLF